MPSLFVKSENTKVIHKSESKRPDKLLVGWGYQAIVML